MLPVALSDYPGANRITTNSGIKLMLPPLAPHYYFISDHLACKEFAADAMELRHTHGTQIITLGRLPSAIISRGLTSVDYLIDQARPDRPCDYTRGVYTDCMFSGLYCTQFAINNGAKIIVAVGHEGYPEDEENACYWDGGAPVNKRQALAYTKNWIGPWWRNAVAACPDITFHFYGRLRFAIDGPNVKKTTDACAIPALLAANAIR
jgi:hypothetical protein